MNLDVIEYIEIALARVSSVILYNPLDAKGGRSGTSLHEFCDKSQDLYVTLYARTFSSKVTPGTLYF